MSIHRQLRDGCFTPTSLNSWGSRSSYGYFQNQRLDTITGRLRARQRARRADIALRYSQPRTTWRPYVRDSHLERTRLGDEASVETFNRIEKEVDEEEAARRLEESRLEELKKEILMVQSVELHVDANTENHRTDRFFCTDDFIDPQLVVRRGQEFMMTLTFQRPYDDAKDDLYLMFKIGEEPNVHKGTCANMKLREGKKTNYMTGQRKRWGARILKRSGNDITVGVYPSPKAIIGEWEYSIRTVKGKKKEIYECEGSNDIIVLLNPWCEDDTVYMADTKDLNEYVLNDSGTVFRGDSASITASSWNYGQFKEGILETCLYLLRKANNCAISAQMNDPVYIARALSRILNDADDCGVLQGNWSGDYSGGVRPTCWKGSAAILTQYRETVAQPVKYGQCWVFSHLLTTVARALGLPCRSITNFSSAHDTDLTMTIDKYVDEDGDEVGFKNGDSVWNFHVWNEVWMLRPDLDKDTPVDDDQGRFGGWHAVDATPQETSDGVFQCGPTPLTAVRRGMVEIGYDTKFIFAEVNAECCTWKDGYPPTLLSKNTHRVGKRLSTKWPTGKGHKGYWGRDEGVRLDVTHLYKLPEGSAAERESVKRATAVGDLGELVFTDQTGVVLTVMGSDTCPAVGDDLHVKVKVENTADEKRSVRLRVTVRPTNYWGGLLGSEKIAMKLFSEDALDAKESKVYELPVDADDYLKMCDESLCLRVLAMGTVRDFDEPVFEATDLVISHPDIECKGPSGKVKAGDDFEVTFTFHNPLKKKAMTGCQLEIDGSVGTQDSSFERKHSVYIKPIEDLGPGETRCVTVQVFATVKPKKSRDRELDVSLGSNELPDFQGCLAIELK